MNPVVGHVNSPHLARDRRSRLVAYLFVPLLIVTFGCGTGEYDRQMRKTLEELRTPEELEKGQVFDMLYESPTEVPGIGVSLRIPKLLDATAKSWRPGSLNAAGEPIDESRIQPPFVKLPGFQFCYERFVPDQSGGQQPVYCYVAVSDSKDASQEDLIASVQKDLKAKFSNAPATWEETSLNTPDGGTLTCRRISVTGPQGFVVSPEGRESKDSEGRMDLYLYSNETHHVLVGWRAPSGISEELSLFEVAEASVATVQVTGAAATQ